LGILASMTERGDAQEWSADYFVLNYENTNHALTELEIAKEAVAYWYDTIEDYNWKENAAEGDS